MRGDGSIQFGPTQFKPKPPPESPEWLKAFGKFLKSLFEPVGEAMGMSWPVLSKVLIGIAVLCVLLLAWRMAAPLLGRNRRKADGDEPPEWVPDKGAALALLEDADKLAAAGHFDEATHLLLTRSVGQIAAARPGWLNPASTAREIALNTGLPEKARNAFALIAQRVERSLFALIPLKSEDWQAARAAYADFALTEIRA
jgi:hypothetical protein